ncbi:helix-turn-helix domain-containing protein [Embleya sp. NBC_00896]|uniref:helix-turn-helix domain-containing protein n=1 Tax=Embleya sp. NBC_00896 TaxID=2975961 RepID=UPI003864976D|nr:pyridoxamine 5'-phosphate oxidase family protein [Embleya sp. NBC_00896]
MYDETAGTVRPDANRVSANARARRRELGLSVADVAEKSGLPLAWVESLEEGTAPLSRSALAHLAATLDTTIEHLMSPGDAVGRPGLAGATVPGSEPGPALRELVEMGEEECRARLVLHEVGRLSPGAAAEPFVLPVNYLLDGQDIVFRTAEGSTLSYVEGQVAFEVDDMVREARFAWSVLVIGDVERVIDRRDVARLSEADLQPWPDGTRDVWLRIRPQRITGRRVRPRPGLPG